MRVYLRILKWFSQRIGPDPFPADTDPQEYNVDDMDTWCKKTWEDKRQWLAPYLAWVIFINICNTCN